jgi:2-dehydro-3-deoxy-D-arabinonate dehydratase
VLANSEDILDLTTVDSSASFISLLENARHGSEKNLDDFVNSKIERAGGAIKKYAADQVSLKIPFLPPEVWAAGVTYVRSKEAREVETSRKGIYDHVYDSKRPEIFFKSTGQRCVGPDEMVGIRSDSKWSVPEPELAVVLRSDFEIVGYTIGNDMSARDIEGENPLYLPQAKIYRNCCALGPVVATPNEIADPHALEINMTITRNGKKIFRGSTSTSKLKRKIEELIHFLSLNNTIQNGTVLLTGTGIVPPDDFALLEGDLIEIEIEHIGRLRNVAKVLSPAPGQS